MSLEEDIELWNAQGEFVDGILCHIGGTVAIAGTLITEDPKFCLFAPGLYILGSILCYRSAKKLARYDIQTSTS